MVQIEFRDGSATHWVVYTDDDGDPQIDHAVENGSLDGLLDTMDAIVGELNQLLKATVPKGEQS